MSESRRRAPAIFTILAVVFILAPIGGVCWWMFSPKPEPAPVVDLDTLDIVCTGRIDVASQIIPLEPNIAGRVIEIGEGITEGAMVGNNTVIVKLDDSVASGRKIAAETAVALAKISLQQAELDVLRFPTQIEAREAMGRASSARVVAAQQALLQREKQSTVTPLGDAELKALKAQISELQEFELAEQKQVKDMKAMKPQYMVDIAKQRLKAADADLVLANKAVEECTVRAPSEGRILRMNIAKGGVMYPGSPMPAIVFAPTQGGLVVRAEVDQEFLGKVKEGMKAKIQDDNRSDSPITNGEVIKLSRWVAQRRSMLLDPGEINDVRTVECVIGLKGDTSALFIGQRMRVRIAVK